MKVRDTEKRQKDNDRDNIDGSSKKLRIHKINKRSPVDPKSWCETQFQTAKELIVKELRGAKKKIKIYENRNDSTKTIIELENSGRLKFLQRRMDSPSDMQRVIRH